MTTPTDNLKRLVKAAGLEAPAHRVIESVDPVWRRERVDNERLGQLMALVLDVDSNRVDIGASTGVTHVAPQ